VDIRGTENQEIAIPKQSLRLPPVGIFVEIAAAEERNARQCREITKKKIPHNRGGDY